MLGLRFCASAFSSCGKRGPLLIALRGPLTIAASLVAEHRLQTRRLSSCGSRAQLLRGTWDLPRPGLKPVSPALAGRFSTTAPPGKPREVFLKSPVSGPSCPSILPLPQHTGGHAHARTHTLTLTRGHLRNPWFSLHYNYYLGNGWGVCTLIICGHPD